MKAQNGQRRVRRGVSSCNPIDNIFNGKNGNPDLAELLPRKILKQLASKSQLTCSTILNLKEFSPGLELEAEYRMMSFAASTQAGIGFQNQNMGVEESSRLFDRRGDQDHEDGSPKILDRTAMGLLNNPEFLEKLNQFIFEMPLEKKWQPPTKCSLEF